MKSLTLILSTLFVLSAFAGQEKLIYGDDNRVDVYESTNPLFQKLAISTAAQISKNSLVSTGTDVLVRANDLRARGICASERFSEQPAAARCSGFLVGPKQLVTAGHCITNMDDCMNNSWVFDYKMSNAGSLSISVPASSVYSCSRIISRALDGGLGNDYALIELDRAVTDREILKVRTSGKPAIGDEMVVIGHPTGLPTKIADGAHVRSLKGPYFVANLDTYGGNSGSAVFSVKSGLVEGILVRGDNDYVRDANQGCQVSNLCPENGCRGEDVTYITNVKELVNGHF